MPYITCTAWAAATRTRWWPYSSRRASWDFAFPSSDLAVVGHWMLRYRENKVEFEMYIWIVENCVEENVISFLLSSLLISHTLSFIAKFWTLMMSEGCWDCPWHNSTLGQRCPFWNKGTMNVHNRFLDIISNFQFISLIQHTCAISFPKVRRIH